MEGEREVRDRLIKCGVEMSSSRDLGFSFFFFITLDLELSDTKVYEP